MLHLLLSLSCSGAQDPTAHPPEAKPSAEAPPPTQAAQPWADRKSTTVAPDEGWGAVFWVEGSAWQVGGAGTIAIGRKAHGPVGPRDGAPQPACPGARAVNAPEKAALVLPLSVTAASNPPPAPAIDASIVEKAAWRLDELLPPADPFTPRIATRRATAQGVELGSVVKARRNGAPPMLLVSGTRSCTSVVAALSEDGTEVLRYREIPQMCDPPGLLNPHDVDGDGMRETAATSGPQTVALRLVDQSGDLDLALLGSWSCTAATPRRAAQLEQAP